MLVYKMSAVSMHGWIDTVIILTSSHGKCGGYMAFHLMPVSIKPQLIVSSSWWIVRAAAVFVQIESNRDALDTLCDLLLCSDELSACTLYLSFPGACAFS